MSGSLEGPMLELLSASSRFFSHVLIAFFKEEKAFFFFLLTVYDHLPPESKARDAFDSC